MALIIGTIGYVLAIGAFFWPSGFAESDTVYVMRAVTFWLGIGMALGAVASWVL